MAEVRQGNGDYVPVKTPVRVRLIDRLDDDFIALIDSNGKGLNLHDPRVLREIAEALNASGRCRESGEALDA